VNWRVSLRKVLVSPRFKSSSVIPLVNRASSSSLVFDTRLRRLLTLSTVRFRETALESISFYKRERKKAAKAILTFFHIVDDPFAQQS